GYIRPLDQPEGGDAEIDQLDLLFAGVIVAERAQVRRVEGVDERGEEPGIDRAGGRRDANLHRLAGVADVGCGGDADARKIDPVAYEAVDGIFLQAGVERRDSRQIDRVLVHHLGDDAIGAPVDREQPEGGQIAGIAWDDARRHAEQVH